LLEVEVEESPEQVGEVSPMEIKEGTRVKNNLTGEVYRVEAVKGMGWCWRQKTGSVVS
jgi:hypothetical protein